MKVTGKADSILQGVSTQPPRARARGQCTEQINLRSNPVKGLTRRQPLIHKRTVLSDDTPHIYRVSSDNYNMILRENNSLVMYDVTKGTKSTILNSGNHPYITSGNLKYHTIGKETYVLNTDKKVLATKDSIDKSLMTYGLWAYVVTSGVPERKYTLKIKVGGNQYSSNFTPNNTAEQVQPGYIADNLRANFTSNITDLTVEGTSYTFSVGSINNVVYLQMKYSTGTTPIARPEVAVSIETSNASDLGYIVNNSVESVDKLPKVFLRPFIGLPVESSTDNFVVFQPTEASKGDKWIETSDIFQERTIDKTTMPHKIQLKENGSYELVPVEWDKRLSGNQDNNPLPEFVNKTITSIGLVHNRLVFTSDYSVSLSRTDDLHNFFRNTTLEVQDTDPVLLNTPISVGDDSIIEQTFMNSQVYFFSKAGQFLLKYQDFISPKTASLQTISTYTTLGVPASSGTTILFGSVSENTPVLRELTTLDQYGNVDVQSISNHAIGYIKGTLDTITASSDDNIALVQTSTENTLYVYEWVWQGAERILQAWSKWQFNDISIKYLNIIDSKVYILYSTGTGGNIQYNLGTVDLQHNDNAVYIDNQKKLTSDAAPADYDKSKQYIVSGETSRYPRNRLTVKSGTIQGFDQYCYIGNKITSTYTPTYPYYVDYLGKTTEDKLSLTGFYVRLNDTGDIKTSIKRDGYPDMDQNYGVHVGVDTLGKQNLFTGKISIDANGTVDDTTLDIYIDTHQPMNMTDLTYKAKLSKRHRTMRK